MDTYIVIWYDLDSEKERNVIINTELELWEKDVVLATLDEVNANSPDDAIAKATKRHNGIKPAELATAVRKDSV